uniref:NlpC/P60 family protein n=1 Tax=Streptomyces sp. NBC_01393 TaxID=2903851 RepID=A0AAU3I6V1_9ACTN
MAGQGPLLGWNKAQDAIADLTKNIEGLSKSLQEAGTKFRAAGKGAYEGWNGQGSGTPHGARGFGMLANDVWNGTSNYAHGRANGGADAPTTAPGGTNRASMSGYSWARTPNGGGATFSGQNGQGGGAANNGGQGGGSGPATPGQVGGAHSNGSSPHSLKSGLQKLNAWAVGQLGDQVMLDTAAYQAAQGSSVSKSAIINQMRVRNMTAYSTTDAAQAYTTLARYSSAGSSTFNANWNWVKSAGYLDPSQSEAQRAAGAAAAWNPSSYYGGQIIGIQTIRNGKGQNPQQIAKQVFQKYGLNAVKNREQLNATINSPNSKLNQMLASTLDPGLARQVQTELKGMASAQINGASMSDYTATTKKAASGDSAARKTLSGWGLGGSDAQALLDRQNTQDNQQAYTSEAFSHGLKDATKALDSFTSRLQGVLKNTGLDSMIGYTGGMTSMVGGAVGSGLGMYGMMRGLGSIARFSGFGGGGGATAGTGATAASAGASAGADAGATTAAAAGGGGLLSAFGLPALGLSALAGAAGIGWWDASNAKKHPVKHAVINNTLGQSPNLLGGATLLGKVLRFVPAIANAVGRDGISGGAGGGAGGASAGGGNSKVKATGTQGAGKTAAAVIKIAMKYVGVKYVWGGSSPKGFDCSGLIQYSFRQIGVSLPRTAAQQQKAGHRVKLSEVRAGDLLFQGDPAHHVVMYIGGGKIIEAPHTNSHVKIRSFSPSEFTNAVRILGSVGSMSDIGTDSETTAGSDSNRLSTMGFGGDTGSYGSVEEVDALAAGITSVGLSSSGSSASPGRASSDDSSGSAPSNMPTGNVKSWIKSALGILHQDTRGNESIVNTMIQHESSGNPHSINLWDSNAKAGHPSKGIMQTIDSVFNAYSVKGHKDIWNPVDNIIAGVRYAESRYHSLANVPGIKSMANGGAYKGYSVGSTNIDVDQTARVHKGEMIIPAAQAEAMRQALAGNTPLAGGLNTSAARAANVNFSSGSVVIQVQGVMDQQSARDAAQQFMTALAEDDRINLIAAGN